MLTFYLHLELKVVNLQLQDSKTELEKSRASEASLKEQLASSEKKALIQLHALVLYASFLMFQVALLIEKTGGPRAPSELELRLNNAVAEKMSLDEEIATLTASRDHYKVLVLPSNSLAQRV